MVPTLVACRIRNYPNNSARANRLWLSLVAWGLSTIVVTASVLGLIVWLGDRNEEPVKEADPRDGESALRALVEHPVHFQELGVEHRRPGRAPDGIVPHGHELVTEDGTGA